MGLKMPEILLIFAVLMLLFGGSRLPQLGASLGSAIRNFKKGFSGEAEPTNAEEAKKSSGALASNTTVEKDVSAGSKATSNHG